VVTEAPAAILRPDDVRAFTRDVLIAIRMRPDDAEIVGEAFAWADLRGIAAQGIAKLPLLVGRIRAGGTSARAMVTVVRQTPNSAVLDAHDAWGHVAGVRGMRLAIEKARAGGGLGYVVVRNTSSGSAMGYYPSLAVAEGLIGLAINTTSPLMAPSGGTTIELGNQAFAIGAPAGRHPAIVFDSALSAISWTGIERLLERGEPLPEGAALTADGEPTTEGLAAMAGILLPMGGHRGYGLALMWEVLAGILSGGERFGREIAPTREVGRPQGLSHALLAIDPAAFGPREAFLARVDALIDQVHASPPMPGVDRVRVPGERREALAAERERDGVPVTAEAVAELRELGRELGVPWPGT
jgi:LDH2 family malate/lactate/ureidoglycolate dehydrogenase